MKQTTRLAMLLCLIMLPPWNGLAQAPGTVEEPCKVVIQALEAAKRLKPGMLRMNLEKDFEKDGGIAFFERDGELSFTLHARYVYRKCPYIKIDVDITVEGTTEAPIPSPMDRITSVSRPYLDYPLTD